MSDKRVKILKLLDTMIPASDAIRSDSVAVVGNGPLSNRDRRDIEKCPCIIRFNDQKNKRCRERTDIVVLRYNTLFKQFSGRGKTDQGTVPKATYCWPVCSQPKELLALQTASTLLLPILTSGTRDGNRDIDMFPGCNACNSSACKHTLTKNGPSSGGAVIDALQKMSSIKQIDVFGMNWNGWKDVHVDFKFPKVIDQCCSKCVIHVPPSQIYDGRGAFKVLFEHAMYALRVTAQHLRPELRKDLHPYPLV